MLAYRLGPLTLASNHRLPEVPRGARAAGASDWTFHLDAARPAAKAGPWVRRLLLPDGRQWLSVARRDRRYLLRFHRLADFHLDLDARTIACTPRLRATAATIRHLLLDQVLPMVAARGPMFALHASAIRSPAGIVGFLGPAGSGKSTLAVALARRGHALIGDDCLFVDAIDGEVSAVTTYAGARLHADSLRAICRSHTVGGSTVAQYTRKQRVDPRRAGLRIAGGRPRERIEKLYVLAPDARRAPGRPRVTPLSARPAMLELLRFTFHLDPEDRAELASRFELAAIATRQVPVCRLSFRHDFSGLEVLRACVEADLRR